MATKSNKTRLAFTLVEMLLVLAIITLLSVSILASIGQTRAKGRDAKRIEDMKQITNALNLYFADKGTYPSVSGTETGCTPNAGWDCSHLGGDFIPDLVPKYLSQMPVDPTNNNTYHYMYYRTTGSIYDCVAPPARGKYVLGISMFETNPGYSNPNFCNPNATYFKWASGNFEN